MVERKLAFERPRLRPNVMIGWRNHTAALSYREQGCELDIPAEAETQARLLLELLVSGARVGKLVSAAPLLADQLPDFLEELDRLGLLLETHIPFQAGNLCGEEFYYRLRLFASKVTASRARNIFHRALTSRSVSREQLIGYVIEYYHLVNHASRIIAPALSHADTKKTHIILSNFLASEMGHDRMLLEALNAVGIREEHVTYLMPLPATFALISALAVLAAQDPLSFKSMLFVFEEADARFGKAFEQRCKELDMPTAFFEPVLRHADLNDEYDHGDISRDLLSEVAVVTIEQQSVVKKHVAVVLESLVEMETEILEHYVVESGHEGRRKD